MPALSPQRFLPLAMSSTSMSSRIRSLWIPSSSQQLQAAEAKVLSRVRTPFQQRLVRIDDDLHINTVHFARGHRPRPSLTAAPPPPSTVASASAAPDTDDAVLPPSGSSPPLVLLHGFGAGLALWYGNFDSLAARVDDLYAVDLLGCGRSSRPPFTAANTAEAEAFFVDSLEAWRRANGIDCMILAGHSLGGYLASVYSLAHPSRVARLILLSPVGVPEKPPGADTRGRSLPFPQRMLYSALNQLWTAGVTPQQIVKAAGPYGKGFIERYVTHRFKEDIKASAAPAAELAGEMAVSLDMDAAVEVPAMDKPAVAEYLYQSITAKGSGEFALSKILSPGAYAQQPLMHRLPALASHPIPVTLVYGMHDWMDVRAGAEVAQRIRAAGAAAVTLRVKGAGHQLFADNVAGFHEAMQAGLTLPAREEGEDRHRAWVDDTAVHSRHLLFTE